MNIGKLSLNDSLAILREVNFGKLGCIAEGKPYVLPIHYYFDGEDIYVHSLPGKKIEALRANPNACVQVEEIRDAYHWRSVIAFGTYEELTDEEAKEKILAQLFRRLPHLSPVESRMMKKEGEAIIFRIKVEEISGVGEEW